MSSCAFLFQAEDGIRYLVRSRGLGDVYKRQVELGHRISPEDFSKIEEEMKKEVKANHTFEKVVVLSLIHI